MNRALTADQMLNYTDLTVLERQRARLKCRQDHYLNQEQMDHYGYNGNFLGSGVYSIEPDSILENGWPDLEYSGFGHGNGSVQEVNYGFTATDVKVKGSVSSEKMSGTTVRSASFKKRKFVKANLEENQKEKKIKGCVEEGEESKITQQNTRSNNNKSINKSINKKPNCSNDTSKDNSKVTDVQKPDYIHVRARRGQATDSHSLAERVRREKISERMKYLQDLVPGCDKITGKAGMLDEIINYVQSLQKQVEFLSMKLAAVNPRLDFNIDEIFPKEVFSGSASDFPNIAVPSPDTTNPIYNQFNPMQQVVSCSGMETVTNPNSDASLRRFNGATLALPETFFDSSCFTQLQPTLSWDADLQNLYNNSIVFDQERSLTSFPSQPFTGSMSTSDLKMKN